MVYSEDSTIARLLSNGCLIEQPLDNAATIFRQFFRHRAYYNRCHILYRNMNRPIETHPLYATFRIRTAGAGGRCACGHLRTPEIVPQNRHNFRSNSTGKERDEETGYSYFGARYMDHALLTGWLSVDPMADKYPSLSPYNYCAWNPIRLVDPDGREVGDFYASNGKYLGSDGRKDGKVYVVRNGEAALCSTWDLGMATLNVKLHSGNSEYFDAHPEIYDNFISILPLDMLSDAYNTIQDDGSGGTSPSNNREYGGYTNADGTKWEQTVTGPVADPETQDAEITLRTDRINFHSHPSGRKMKGSADRSSVGQTTFKSSDGFSDFKQYPSEKDKSAAGNITNYVFGMGNGNLYIYNGQGTQAKVSTRGLLSNHK